MNKYFTALLFFLLSPFVLTAIVKLVPDNFGTIQSAIDNSGENDTIIVREGVYYENLKIKSMKIVLGSMFLTTGDTSYISRTIIDGNNKGSVIWVSERDSSQIAGLSITNGCGTKDYYTTMGTILDSIYYGGGFYITDSCATKLENLRIYNNKADLGGGLCIITSKAVINNLFVENNRALEDGGGLFYSSKFGLDIYSSLFKNNYANSGGGLLVSTGFYNSLPVNFIKTIIADNHNSTELKNDLTTGILGLGANLNMTNVTVVNNDISMSNHILNIQNSILYNSGVYLTSQHIKNSTSVSYSNIQNGENAFHLTNSGMVWGEGNIITNPGFIDYESGNYRLTMGSPCINAGNPDIAYNDSDGSRNDIGAYSYFSLSAIDKTNKTGEYLITSNPSQGILTINPELEGKIISYTIYNLLGKIVKIGRDIDLSIDISYLESGIYTLCLETDKNHYKTKFKKE